MAYSWQNNTKQETKTTTGKYSWQTGGLQPTLEEKVSKQKEELIKKGLPVSVSKTRAEPTLAGSIIRGAIKPVADVASNLLGGTDLSNKYLGKVEGLGQLNMDKPLSKENLKVLGKSVATGVELGSYATGGGAIVSTGKNLAKQGVKEFIKTSGKQLAKEGAITSGLGSVGYQGREGKINPLTVARDTAIGAVAAPLLGAGVNKLLGKSAPKIAKKIPEQPIKDSKLAQDLHSWTTGGSVSKELPQDTISKLKTNKIGVDELPVNDDGTITLFRTGNIEKGKAQSYSAKRIDPNQVEVRVPKEDVLANLNSSKIDDLYNNSFSKEEIEAGFLDQRKLNKFEKEVIAISDNKKPEQPKTIQKVQPIKPEENVLNDIPEFKDLDPEVKKTTFQEIRTNYDNISKTNSVDDLIDISMGKKEVPQGLTKTSIYELTKNRKDLTLEQIKRLKNIAPESEAGLNLVTVKLRDGGLIDNPTDFIQATEKTMKEQVKKSGITSKTINRFLDGLECK